MHTRLQKWGNSQGLRIPKTILEKSHVNVGDELEISAAEGEILLKKTHKVHGRYDIKALVDQMPEDYSGKEENWGAPVGKEIW